MNYPKKGLITKIGTTPTEGWQFSFAQIGTHFKSSEPDDVEYAGYSPAELKGIWDAAQASTNWLQEHTVEWIKTNTIFKSDAQWKSLLTNPTRRARVRSAGER